MPMYLAGSSLINVYELVQAVILWYWLLGFPDFLDMQNNLLQTFIDWYYGR
jgi:hypothetical protein